MLPAIVLAIPVLLIFRPLGLKDTVAALVLVDLAFLLPLVVWLLRNVVRRRPEGPRVSGPHRWLLANRHALPGDHPGGGAGDRLGRDPDAVGTWNEFLFAVTLGDREAVTITRRIGMVDTLGGVGRVAPFTLIAAAGFVAVLPCLVSSPCSTGGSCRTH